MQAIWNGAVVADSNDTVVVEGNHYFPFDSVASRYLVVSDHQSVCHWKGVASYYTLDVDGKRNENAAWHYPIPSAEAKSIRGRVAFWQGVQVVETTAPDGRVSARSAVATATPAMGIDDMVLNATPPDRLYGYSTIDRQYSHEMVGRQLVVLGSPTCCVS